MRSEPVVRGGDEIGGDRSMSARITLMAVIASLAMGQQLKAEEPKADEPYTANVGDKPVTSIKRDVTKGVGLGREELLESARNAIPIMPQDPREDNPKQDDKTR